VKDGTVLPEPFYVIDDQSEIMKTEGIIMDWKFVVALVFALLVAVFALQNAEAVDISFLTFDFSVSQALVILISAVFGALTATLMSLVRWIKSQTKIRSLSKVNSTLEQENKQMKLKLEAYTQKKDTVPETAETPSGN